MFVYVNIEIMFYYFYKDLFFHLVNMKRFLQNIVENC